MTDGISSVSCSLVHVLEVSLSCILQRTELRFHCIHFQRSHVSIFSYLNLNLYLLQLQCCKLDVESNITVQVNILNKSKRFRLIVIMIKSLESERARHVTRMGKKRCAGFWQESYSLVDLNIEDNTNFMFEIYVIC